MPLTDQQIVEFMRKGLAQGISPEKIRAVLKADGVDIPQETMQFDVGQRTPSQDIGKRGDLTGTQTLGPGQYETHKPPWWETALGFGAKTAIQTAPFLAGGVEGAALGAKALPAIGEKLVSSAPSMAKVLLRSPYLGRLLGSATGQGVVSLGEDVAHGQAPSPSKAAIVAGTSLAVEGATGGLGYGASRAAGVPGETVRETMQMAPAEQRALIYGRPPKNAELQQVDIATERAKEALAKKTVGRRQAEEKMFRYDLEGVVPEGPSPETHPLSAEQFHKQYSSVARAEHVKGTEFGGQPAHLPGERFEALNPNAKAIRKAAISQVVDAGEYVPRQILEEFPDLLYKQEARVDTTPIKDRLRQMIKSESWRSEEQKSANEILRKKISELPDEMKMRDFDQWITEHTKRVGKQIGAIDQQLPVEARREIVRFSRQYRNELLPQAKRDFMQASRDLASYKRFRKQIMEAQGDPKISVESVWRRLPQNQELLRTFRRFDEAATRNGIPSRLTEDALYLAKKRDWTSDDVFHAYVLLRGAQRFIIRPLIAKPAIAAAPTAGRLAGAATSAFTQAMQGPEQ